VVDATGVLTTVQPGFVEESGWQTLRYDVPSDAVYPVKLRRIYFNEIDPNASYHGTTVIDELVAVQRRPVVNSGVPVEDPIVIDSPEPDVGDLTFAVVSDVGIDAGDPTGIAAEEARRVLSEIRESGVDLVVVTGGFVAKGSSANLAFARQLLDEELQGISYYYVPGPAELDRGSLAAFEAEFGPMPQVVDHGGVRFVLLDTSRLTYRASDWSQLPLIRDQLDAAADDDDVESVVVIQNRPLRDAAIPDYYQLADRKEAATVEAWFTEFRESSGKGVVAVGAGTGAFNALRVDGVPQVINGPGSITNVAEADYGGFAGWSLWTAGDETGPDGLQVQFIPRADSVTIDGPATMTVGTTEAIDAVVTQGESDVAMTYPMAAQWSASGNVFVGPDDDAERRYTAVLDPDTGTVTALRPGSVTINATANGNADKLRIVISPDAPER
jgi:hypothetical protein